MTIAKWKEDTPTDPRKYMSTTCVTHEHETPAHKAHRGLRTRSQGELRTKRHAGSARPARRKQRTEVDIGAGSQGDRGIITAGARACAVVTVVLAGTTHRVGSARRRR